ncbi:MAG: hypothetical protein DRI28_06460 [Caldiserica bacterium]|nr:MAG: hypothetical protein DRI28_06460 [Caldisericota bacterium]
MIIDFHAHIGNSDVPGASILQHGCTPELLLYLDEQAGIDKSVVFPTTYLDYQKGNEIIAEAVKKYPDRFIGFLRADPKHKNALEVLKRGVEELNLKGLKLVPRGEDFQNPVLDELLEKCAEYKIPAIMCCCEVDREEIELARKHPRTTIILAHMGAYIDWQSHRLCIQATRELSNVYLETSTVLTQVTLKEAGNQVPDKVLFGSDAPALNPRAELEKIKAMESGPEIEKKDLGRKCTKTLVHSYLVWSNLHKLLKNRRIEKIDSYQQKSVII